MYHIFILGECRVFTHPSSQNDRMEIVPVIATEMYRAGSSILLVLNIFNPIQCMNGSNSECSHSPAGHTSQSIQALFV